MFKFMYEYSDLEKVWKNLFDNSEKNKTDAPASCKNQEEPPKPPPSPQPPKNPNHNSNHYHADFNEDNFHRNSRGSDHNLRRDIEMLKNELDRMQKKYHEVVHLLQQKDQEIINIDRYLSQIEELVNYIE